LEPGGAEAGSVGKQFGAEKEDACFEKRCGPNVVRQSPPNEKAGRMPVRCVQDRCGTRYVRCEVAKADGGAEK